MMIKLSSWYHNLEENRQLICPRSKLAWLIKTFPGIYYSVMTAIRARTLPSLSPFSLYTSENNKEVSKTYLCQLKGPLKVSARKIYTLQQRSIKTNVFPQSSSIFLHNITDVDNIASCWAYCYSTPSTVILSYHTPPSQIQQIVIVTHSYVNDMRIWDTIRYHHL